MNNPQKKTGEEVIADRTPRREGGEDSVENIAPDESRADEKVVANPHGPVDKSNLKSLTESLKNV